LHHVNGRRWNVVMCCAVVDVLVFLFQVRQQIDSEDSMY
jgi:hypothetical protein